MKDVDFCFMGIIRFILAIAVVLEHSSAIWGFSFVGGEIAVKAFYIISGFYMSLILNEKYIGVNNSYSLFITNRFLRLYPIYWTILLLTVLYSVFVCFYSHGTRFGGFSNYVSYYDTMSFTSFFFLLFTNLFIVLQDTVMFLGLDTVTGQLFFTPDFQQTNPSLYNFLFIPQAWTIGIEITFYLIVPFLVRKKTAFILFLIFLSLLLRFFLFQHGLKADPWSYRFFPSELVFFLLGMLSYRLYLRFNSIPTKILYLKIIWGFILIFSLLFSFLNFLGKESIYLFLFFLSLPFIFILTKDWKRDRYLGELSYPIYLSHHLILVCIIALGISKPGGLSLSIITILFAFLLNELVSKRIEKIRQKRMVLN